MKIKQIFDEIANESSTNKKIEILNEYKDNKLLERVLYLANSKRVKFYIKQIPEYEFDSNFEHISLEDALSNLDKLIDRTFTGHQAIEWLTSILNSLDVDDAYIIERIIEKNCKINLGTTLINKVFPSLVEKTNYMGCIPFDVKKANALFENNATCISELKADGKYLNIIIFNHEVEMEGRSGENSFIGNCDLVEELSKLDDCVLNCEIVMKGISRLESNGIIASIIDIENKKADRTQEETNKKINKFIKEKGMTIEEALSLVELKVWDIIDVEEYYLGYSPTIRIDRLNRLKSILSNSISISIVEHRFVKTYEEAMQHFSEALERGEEGTVLKSLDGVWKNGKHNYQIKLKIEISLDLVAKAFNYGKRGTKNEHVISTIYCESSCGKLSAKAQGLKENMMVYVTENQDSLLNTIVEIKCNGLSSNSNGGNSVFFPAFKEFRTDKTEANSFEECVEIYNAAMGLK
jgi:hypothetical protein